MDEITKKILQMFDDDSFPSLVIIDDEWGTGKSHYIATKLLPELKKNNKYIIHFSLYGISTINEFTDKVIIEHYLNRKTNLNLLTSTINLITKITSKLFKSHGFIPKEIIKNYSAISREILYGKIKNTAIILDDLERINDVKLINNILGKCLELTKKNIKIVIATNSKSLSIDKCYDKSFNNKISLNIPYESILDISFPWLNGAVRDLTIQAIKYLRIKNIRILKKASRLSASACNILKKTCANRKVNNEIISNMINTIIIFTYLQYEYNYKFHDFIDKYNENRISNESIKSINNRFFDDENAIAPQITTALDYELVDFIFNGDESSLIKLFSKIEKVDPVNELFLKFKSKSYRLNESTNRSTENIFKHDINLLFSTINKNIFHNEEIMIDEWKKNVLCFMFLLKHKFVRHEKYSFNDNLINTLMQRSLKIKYQESNINSSLTSHLIDEEIRKNMQAITDNYLNVFYKSKFATSIKEILSDDNESFYDLNNYYSNTQILAQIGAARLARVLPNWPARKLDEFTNSLIKRYNNDDKIEKLSQEIITLNQLNNLLVEHLKNKPESLTFGMISILCNVICNIQKIPANSKLRW
jgi:hypothetical protein